MTAGGALSLDFAVVGNAGEFGPADEAELRSLARSILKSEGASGEWSIVVALISDDELQALHLQFMGIDEPTDIMTFPYGEATPGGDLAISVDHVITRATEWGNSPAQELQFLVAHGVLHLLGWQDTSPEQRTAMLEQQERLVRAWREGERR